MSVTHEILENYGKSSHRVRQRDSTKILTPLDKLANVVKASLLKLHTQELKDYIKASTSVNLFCYESIDDEDTEGLPKHKRNENMPFFKQIKAAARTEFFKGIE